MEWPPKKTNTQAEDGTKTDFVKQVNELAKFNTDGYDKYPKEEFTDFVKKNNINVKNILDEFLKKISKEHDNFSLNEISFIGAFRAWLHSEHKQAMDYVSEKFDFSCKDDSEFLEKYKFTNILAFFISENQNYEEETEEIKNELDIFNKLKERYSEEKGSFLLRYLAEDYINIIDGEKESIRKESDFDYKPFKVDNERFGFDTRSGFALLNKHDLQEGFLLSDPKDYKVLENLIGQIDTLVDQEQFDEIKQYFKPITEKDINVNNEKKSSIDITLFRKLQEGYHRRKLESITGIKLSSIPIKEQNNFINYLKFTETKDLPKIKRFNKKYTINGFRTFLSIAHGGKEMGDKIIELGEKLEEETSQKVFAKYGEIVDNVSKITEFARNNFTKEIETNPTLIEKIEETLYLKGKQLLSQTYDDINNKKTINYENISKQLDRINADTITTFAIFKQAVKNGEKLPIESIEGSLFSKKEAVDISLTQQDEMLELYESNWKNHLDRDFVESLKSYFKTAFSPEANKQKNYFYTFEKDNNIRAFVRFEKQDGEGFYASALNVDEASKNFGLGEAMMDEALTREAREHVLYASCRKDNPSNMRYFEKGFISRGFKKTNDTEEFDLVWDEKKNKNILAKQKSPEELVSMYGNANTEGIEIRKSKDLESLHYDIAEGKSLVRCFVANGEWYAVYETTEDDYGVNRGEAK